MKVFFSLFPYCPTRRTRFFLGSRERSLFHGGGIDSFSRLRNPPPEIPLKRCIHFSQETLPFLSGSTSALEPLFFSRSYAQLLGLSPRGSFQFDRQVLSPSHGENVLFFFFLRAAANRPSPVHAPLFLPCRQSHFSVAAKKPA